MGWLRIYGLLLTSIFIFSSFGVDEMELINKLKRLSNQRMTDISSSKLLQEYNEFEKRATYERTRIIAPTMPGNPFLCWKALTSS
jgi:hypothetical protein